VAESLEGKQPVTVLSENPLFGFLKELSLLSLTRKKVVLKTDHGVLQDSQQQLLFRLQRSSPVHRIFKLCGG
jgi:hypothetical protein